MILVDTNVFVDLWTRDPRWAAWSEEALARAAEAGPLGVNPIIYAELCLGFEKDRPPLTRGAASALRGG